MISKLQNIFKKENKTQSEITKDRRKKSAQDFLNVANIDGDIIYQKNGSIATSIKIDGKDLSLMTEREKKIEIENFAEQLNQISYDFQILSLARNVDISNYVFDLEKKLRNDKAFERKKLLRMYLAEAKQIKKQNDTIERNYYMLISEKKNKQRDIREVRKKRDEVSENLNNISLKAEILKEQGIKDMFFLMTQQDDFENERDLVQEILENENILAE